MPRENLVHKNSFHTLPTLLETNISPFKITFEDDFSIPKVGYVWFLGGYTDGASAQVTDFLEHWDLSMTKEAAVGRICKTRTKNPPVWLI